MRAKKFVARTLPEAMAQVKADLGSEAIILHTQPVRVGGLFGLFGQRMIEVLAAADLSERKLPVISAARTAAMASEVQSAQQVVNGGALAVPPLSALPQVAAAAEIGQIREEMARVSAMMGQVLERIELPGTLARVEPELKALYAGMVDRGMERELAAALVTKARQRLSGGGVGQHQAARIIRELVERNLGAPATIAITPGERRVVALAGPTGVGKTTTLAKLAAHFTLIKHLRVAVLTADTYRIAAVEQLRTYCDIIGVPLEIIHTPADVSPALGRHRNADLVLVDTAGRSPRNPEQVAELQTYLKVLHPDEVYLVLSLTSSNRDVLAAAEAFAPVGYDRLLLTKLDEAELPGIAYNLVMRCRRPLSYLTTGQNVPDDIETAVPERISRLLLGD